MNNLEKAATLSFEEWSAKMDLEFAEAERLGLIPDKTSEQIKAEAKAIWKKAHE